MAASGNFNFVQPPGENVFPLHLAVDEQGVERRAKRVGAPKTGGEGNRMLQGISDLRSGDNAALQHRIGSDGGPCTECAH